jgi:replicative DNA helicase
LRAGRVPVPSGASVIDEAPSYEPRRVDTNVNSRGRIPPHSLDAERAVLGGVLLDNDAMHVVLQVLKKEDFYSEANARLFDAMMTLYAGGTPIDSVTLRAEVVLRGQLAAVGGDDYVLELTNTIPTVANIEAHAHIVREKSLVRQLILACHEISARGYGDYGEASKFLDEAEKSIFEVAQEHVRSPYEHVKEVVLRTFKHIHEAAERGEKITGLPSGFNDLDEMTSGMHPGDLIIIAGRPGMGKTAFALNAATNASIARKAPVAVFSLEMPKEQLVRRMLCSEARVDGSRLRAGQLWREDWPKLARAAGALSELPMWIDDTPALSMTELRAKARRLRSQHGLELVVVDYLQLMRSGSKNDSREQEISEISRSLKALAKELGIPVIALSQLNRGVESRGGKDKRPQLSDLRESGAIEQDADTILFIYRDEVYNRENLDARNRAEIIIGKQRAGPTGIVQCAFFNEFTRFDNLARDEYSSNYAD